MGKEIKYQSRTTFLGRNGRFHQDGLLVSELGGAVTLAPITSKDEVGRASLGVPKTAIPELIKILRTILKS